MLANVCLSSILHLLAKEIALVNSKNETKLSFEQYCDVNYSRTLDLSFFSSWGQCKNLSENLL